MKFKDIHKLLLVNFKYNDSGQIKIYNKDIFSYPKNKKTKFMFWENHTIIDKYNIDMYIEDILTNKQYKNTKIIHPYLFLLSWDKIKNYFNKKYCKSSKCYELIPKYPHLNWSLQTKEILKIIQVIFSNKLFQKYFYNYYKYLSSEEGIIIHESFHKPSNEKTRFITFQLHISKKTYIFLEINNIPHNKEFNNNNSIEIFNKTNTIPIIYNPNKEDMTNIIPKIYQEFANAIYTIDDLDGIKFYLIMLCNTDPEFTEFIIENYNNKYIYIKDIQELLENIYEMKHFSRYIKQLFKDNYILEDEIIYHGIDILSGKVLYSTLDKIFMKLDKKYFKNKNIPVHFCNQYSIIKNNFIKLLNTKLNHSNKYLNIILQDRQDIIQKYNSIKPVNNIIQDQNMYFYNNLSKDIIKKIKTDLSIELHPTYMFLVRQENNYVDKNTFKKISKEVYHESEESGKFICNYRILKNSEWENISKLLNDEQDETTTEEI